MKQSKKQKIQAAKNTRSAAKGRKKSFKKGLNVLSFAYDIAMLKISIPKFYKVRKGQTLRLIAEAFSVPETRLVFDNALKKEVEEGQILRMPTEKGNLYTVGTGDTKELLCGSKEEYRKKNGTDAFYPGMKIWI